MSNDNVIAFENREEHAKPVHDLLTEALRQGAKQLLAAAVEAEVSDFMEQHQETLGNGKNRLARNGHLPQRDILTGIGEVAVKVPRVRDRKTGSEEVIQYESEIVPKYLRRCGDMNELLPLLYLKGISSGQFVDALTPIVGEKAKNLSTGVISRLKKQWEGEYTSWLRSSLESKKFVYWWADGVYLSARMEHEKQCVLVIMGVTDEGNKELLAIDAGFRESTESWQAVLLSLKQRGLTQSPKVAVGDGAMGFWAALDKVYPEVRHQRCWFHKMGNVLNKLPKNLQPKAKSMLQQIWMSDTKSNAGIAFNQFIEQFSLKHIEAVKCLKKDRDALLSFYDFPAEHWAHIRTSNPIESTFSTVRHRTKKSKNCHSYTTIMAMVFKLFESAQTRWRKLRGFKKLGQVITGVQFRDGVEVDQGTEDKLKKVNNG